MAHEGSPSTLDRPSKIKLQRCVSASLITHSAVTPLAPPLTKNTDSAVTELPASEVVKSRTFFGEIVIRFTTDSSEWKYPTSLMFESGSCSSCRMQFAVSSAGSSGCRSTKRQKTSGHSTLAVLTNPESPLTTALYSPDPIPSCPSILQTETKRLRRLPEFDACFMDAAVFLTVMKACRRKTFSPSSRFNEPDAAEAGLRLIKPPIFPCLVSRSFRED